MTRHESEPDPRWWGLRLVVTFTIISFPVKFTAKSCITASRGTISNEGFLFSTIFTINRRIILNFTVFLTERFGIQMARTVVIRAPYFVSIEICWLRLLLIAGLVRVAIKMTVRTSFPFPVLHITWRVRFFIQPNAIFLFMPRPFTADK